MSSVLDRSALAESPLADLHLLANELGVDGFRRLRKDDLIDAILTKQAGDDLARPEGGDAGGGDDDEEAPTRSRRGRRGGRTRARNGRDDDDDRGDDKPADKPARGGRGPKASEKKDDKPAEDKEIEGVIELLGNGSAFVRLTEGETSDEDVYVSAAQVKRCELVSGDKVAGPMRPPRRSERFPSLVRVDTINGKPADEVSEGTRFDDLPVAFPAERLELGSDDPTVKAIEWLSPFGKGSRVTVVGPARAGKSEALRRIAAALAGREDLEVSIVLAGVRPEEAAEWAEGPVAPIASQSFAASPDAQAQAIEQAVEQGRRVASRGGDAVVLVDSLEYVSAGAARRSMAAARNIAGGGSLTVIAASPAPVGGETTVVTLDAGLTALGRFPALDLAASGTLRAERLVGDAGAAAIAKARADAAGV
jgi:transcription termination factor Rho